jgi:hypothetical protein
LIAVTSAALAGLAAVVLAAPAAAVAPAPPPGPDYFAPLQSGDELWRSCGSSLDTRAPDRCWAYVAGIADAARLAPSAAVPHSCAAADADELTDVVRRFLVEHPESRRRPAAQVVGVALARAYPCAQARAR